ncbi:helix-turn-helix transcriptional regulator [Cognatiyoonia sp. IB215446]|uniref:helix-turn-helix domain-containing protein n=1 Tax=Cognatiyoonia sp. IB215446 TaxID=3097355 RepID=UPI002A122859|nr:helix-turn-helix transcriptional regulator [Cognatiyoonia sp. IB215446]MDX8346510.1 helix-turn-helix transcriptional regulator [Cognatiyoonia sp. IB215446]
MAPVVPNNIAKFRKTLDMSQETLAGRLGISVTQLSRLERGRSSLTQHRMVQLTELFGVEPHALFNDAKTREQLDLDVMRDVIVQLDEMLHRLEITLTPEQRGDLTVELYRLETHGLEDGDLAEHQVDIRRFEGMVRALGATSP